MMTPGIHFNEAIADILTALAQANDRALALALRYGMDTEAAALCRAVYAGALGDVAASFGLALPGGVSHSDLPIPLALAQIGKGRVIATRKEMNVSNETER